VALLNGVLHVILAEGLPEGRFRRGAHRGFEAVRAAVAPYTPEVVERIAGVPVVCWLIPMPQR